MGFIVCYLILAVLLTANLFVLVKVRGQLPAPERRRTFDVIDLAWAFIREKDQNYHQKPMVPMLPENIAWLERHHILPVHDMKEVFLFRYLEEWATMRNLLDLLDPQEVKRMLQLAEIKLRKEIRTIPMHSAEFISIAQQLASIRKHLEEIEKGLSLKSKPEVSGLILVKRPRPIPDQPS